MSDALIERVGISGNRRQRSVDSLSSSRLLLAQETLSLREMISKISHRIRLTSRKQLT